MEIVVSVVAVMVAFCCLMSLMISDVKDHRQKARADNRQNARPQPVTL
jgi:hypothetical protein